MDSFEHSAIQDDPVLRALSGDASSPVYGESLREGLRPVDPANHVMEDHGGQASSVSLLLAATAFLLASLLFW